MQIAITTFLTLVIGAFMLVYIRKHATRKKAISKYGKLELHMHKLYAWLGYPSFILGLGIGIAMFVLFGFTLEGTLLFCCFFGLFGVLGFIMIILYKNHKVTFDDFVITSTSMMNKEQSMRWDEIEKVKFKPLLGMLELKSSTKKLLIHQHLIGLSDFAEQLESKTGLSSKQLKAFL